MCILRGGARSLARSPGLLPLQEEAGTAQRKIAELEAALRSLRQRGGGAPFPLFWLGSLPLGCHCNPVGTQG